MNVSVNQVSPIEVELAITLPWEKVAKQYAKALKKVQNQASVPGFRKGKIPENILKKRYQDFLVSELSREVLPETLEEAVKAQDHVFVGEPKIGAVNLKDGESFDYTVKLQTVPKIELTDYRGVEVERLIVNISDEDVTKEIATRQQELEATPEAQARAITEGESVTLRLTALDGDTELTDLENYVVTLGAPDAHPALSKILLGMGTERDFTGTIEGAEDDSFEEWRGKSVKVFIEVQSLSRETLPELDDAVAQALGAKDLASLKEQVKNQLEEFGNNDADQTAEYALMMKVVDTYDFPVPPVMVEFEAQKMLERTIQPYIQMLQQMPPQQQQEIVYNMSQQYYPLAVKKVRSDIVIDAIGADLKIDLDDAELEEELKSLAVGDPSGPTPEAMRKRIEDAGNLDAFKEMVKRRKTIKALRGFANIVLVEKLTEVPETEMEPADHDGHDHAGHDHAGHEHAHVHGPNCSHNH